VVEMGLIEKDIKDLKYSIIGITDKENLAFYSTL
jgi:hypothetical protein